MANILISPSAEQIEKYCEELKAQLFRMVEAKQLVAIKIEPDIEEEGDPLDGTLAHRYMGTTHTILMGRPAASADSRDAGAGEAGGGVVDSGAGGET